jgi:hypothetical protein
MKSGAFASKWFLLALLTLGVAAMATDAPTMTVNGYVLDSSCAFTQALKKPISKECAILCAKGGSQLVVLSDDGVIYWPISDVMPATSQNARLLPFAGEKVAVTGKIYQYSGSRAIVIKKVEARGPEK